MLPFQHYPKNGAEENSKSLNQNSNPQGSEEDQELLE
jgi:hypothetical protein